jgi:nicotinate-nucleotide pyrophosphorylase (carboxylating)
MAGRNIAAVTHDAGRLLRPSNRAYKSFVLKILSTLYIDDLGDHGDLTTKMLGLSAKRATARVIAKADVILSGMDEIGILLASGIAGKIMLKRMAANGDFVRKGQTLAEITGKASDLLSAERTILNVIGRMSGIAGYAAAMVKKAGDGVVVAPTRKTFWGMMDKRACHDGGAGTHRLNLSDAILVKDNHLTFFDSPAKAIVKISQARKEVRFTEIEAEDEQQIKEIMESCTVKRPKTSAPFYILIDNAKPSKARDMIDLIRSYPAGKRVRIELSGGINLKNISAYARCGADVISSGAMTHSAPWFDVSMDF